MLVCVKKRFFQRDTKEKLKISPRRKGRLVVSYQFVTDACCGLSVIFCGFTSHLIGRETINTPEILSGVHGFTGKTVIVSTTNFGINNVFWEVLLSENILSAIQNC